MLTRRLVGALRRLTSAEWRGLLRAQRALLAAEWSVRTRRTGDLLAAAAPVGARWSNESEQGELPHEDVDTDSGARALTLDAGRAAWRATVAIHRAARYGVFRPRCLTRSIALHQLLRRERLAADIRVGVRRSAGQLTAHAWVELDGQILGDEATHVATYTPLADFRVVP